MKRTLLASCLMLVAAQPALANIDIQFDFSYDTSNFFSSNPDSIATLNAAAAVFETRFADSLSAITSSGSNSFDTIFFNPADPFGSDVTLADQSVQADVILIYVGAANLGGGTLGIGGPGGYGCSGFGAFCSNASSRGQGTVTGSSATDFATWGGAISFDNTSTNWYFGLDASGLGSSQYDFYSVAVHELAHVLGFSSSDSFDNLVQGSNFVGTHVGTMSQVNGVPQEAAMDPTIANNQRKYFTDLDFAAMQDIGWQVTAVPEADTWVMLLAGLGLVGFAARRRMI